MTIKSVKQAFILSMSFLPLAAHCEVTQDIYCFDSGGNGAKNLEIHILSVYAEKWSGGFVKYRGAKSAITLELKGVNTEEIIQGRPDQVTKTWYEVSDGRITGEYEMMSQGANIYSMTYKNYGSHKQKAFTFDPDALVQNGNECQW